MKNERLERLGDSIQKFCQERDYQFGGQAKRESISEASKVFR